MDVPRVVVGAVCLFALEMVRTSDHFLVDSLERVVWYHVFHREEAVTREAADGIF